MSGWKRIMAIFIAMNGVGSGVAIFLITQLGSDPIGLLCDGLHVTLNITFGQASLIYNALLIGIALLYAKNNLGLGSVVYALLSGFFIDFYYWGFSFLGIGGSTPAFRRMLYVVGLILFTWSLALLIEFKLGMNALDAVLYRLSEHLRVPFGVLRLLSDLIYVAVGYVLGGTVGIGSVLCIISIGSLIRLFTKLLSGNFVFRRRGILWKHS